MWTLVHMCETKDEECPFAMVELKPVQDEEGEWGDGLEHECNITADHSLPHKCECGFEFG